MSSNKGLVCQCGGEYDCRGYCLKCNSRVEINILWETYITVEASLSAMWSRLDGITVEEITNVIDDNTDEDCEIDIIKAAEAIKTLINKKAVK